MHDRDWQHATIDQQAHDRLRRLLGDPATRPAVVAALAALAALHAPAPLPMSPARHPAARHDARHAGGRQGQAVAGTLTDTESA